MADGTHIEIVSNDIRQHPAYRLGMMLGAMEEIARRTVGRDKGRIRDIRTIALRAIETEEAAAAAVGAGVVEKPNG